MNPEKMKKPSFDKYLVVVNEFIKNEAAKKRKGA